MKRRKSDSEGQLVKALHICEQKLAGLKTQIDEDPDCDPQDFVAHTLMAQGAMATIIGQVPEPLRTVAALCFNAGCLMLQSHMTERLIAANEEDE